LTSQRGAWFGRDHGETAAQAKCRSRWEAAVTPARMLASEVVRVYSWCQNASLLAAAVAAGGPLAEALPKVRLESPLTSDLGPLGTGYGPGAVATLTWRASCACWKEQSAYRPVR
jgi:hypothetical protein